MPPYKILGYRYIETRQHPLDVCQQLPPVEAYEQQFYEEAKSPYRGLVWLAMLACGVVWFWGTMMIVVFLVTG